MTFSTEKYIEKTEQELVSCCDRFFETSSQVNSAARYSLLNAGKRVRAMLVYLTAQMCQRDWEDYIQLACAVEMVHCYSLIHDDLPCMDNDDLRRGKPSCHKAFDENIALLAGDALIGCSIEVISHMENIGSDEKIKLIQQFCSAMGPKGMIYGQELDLRFENILANEQELTTIHKNKTGQLISLCGKLGSSGAEISQTQTQAITTFFDNIGIVFQMVDDILDVEGNSEELGKPIGSDGENHKSTFITLYGMDSAKRQAKDLTEKAKKTLQENFGENADKLLEYTDYLLNRKK